MLGIDKGFNLKLRKKLCKEDKIYFAVEYTKKIGIPKCPYDCVGCKNKYQVIHNGKGRKKCIRVRRLGTKEVYLMHRPQRYLCKQTGKSFTNERISYRWKQGT